MKIFYRTINSQFIYYKCWRPISEKEKIKEPVDPGKFGQSCNLLNILWILIPSVYTVAKVKKFLLNHPEFLDTYVHSAIDIQTLRDWLKNKKKLDEEPLPEYDPGASNMCVCPNTSLLAHFERGQQQRLHLDGASCCTCTQICSGPRTLRPYIIYAVDAEDEQGCPTQNFTVPRVMTAAEMGAFSRRYGFDIHRRMRMFS